MMGDRIPADPQEPGVIEPEEPTLVGEVDTEDLPKSGTSYAEVPPQTRTLINMQQQERRIT